MATHSSILAWRVPWTEAPGGLQSMGSQKSCRQDLRTKPTLTPDPRHARGKGSTTLRHCSRGPRDLGRFLYIFTFGDSP